MAILPITSLLTGSSSPLLAAGDVLVFVDVSDTTQSAQGSTVKATQTQFFAAINVPIIITSASANALAIGLTGATNAAFQVDSSTASQAAGLKVTGAVAAGTVALAVISSGSNANLSIDAKGSGTITFGGTSTGAVVMSRVTSFAAGTFGAPSIYFSTDTTSGLYRIGANNIGVSISGSKVMDIGAASVAFVQNISVAGTTLLSGIATLTAQPILSSLTASQAVFTDASKGLVSNAITGSGNVVMSASPTFTGTITAAAFSGTTGAFSGDVTLTSAAGSSLYLNKTNATAQSWSIDSGSGGANLAIRDRTGALNALVLTAGTGYATFINGVTIGAMLTCGAAQFSGAVEIGNTVNVVSPTSPNRTVTIVIGGTTYYLAAKTTDD